MKVRYLSAFVLASLSTSAIAQDLAAPKCPSGPPVSATVAQDACQQAFDVYQFMAPQLGLALTGGNATAGQGGVLGGLGHFSVGIRANVFHGKVPDVNNPAFAQSATGAQRRTLPTTDEWVGLPTADAAIGLFKGFPLGLSNILGLDALVSMSYVPTLSRDDFSVTPSSNFQFGYGARLGLLSESLVSPGISLTWLQRDLPKTDLVANLAGASLSVTDTKVSTKAWRVVASKNLIRFSVAAGIGQDKYEQSATVRGSITQFGGSVTAEAPGTSESLSRVNFFGDFAYNLPMLKIVAEIGHATGGTVQTYNSFSGGRADQSYTYGSLGLRLTY
ncbi:MAG TPA: hypothetical protein VNC18_07385 [Gemmatimonadaceae bacterium]|jgi:hypothetical protein|nr:hypothetical protein [Gemmatimonadaceae bacterium]